METAQTTEQIQTEILATASFAGQLLTKEAALAYMLAGKATFTVVSKRTGERLTFRISKVKGDDSGKKFFGGLLNGPDNSADYRYLGLIVPGNSTTWAVKLNRQQWAAKSAQALEWLLNNLSQPGPLVSVEIYHLGRCGRCGRALSVPESCKLGLGPECAGKI